MPHPPAPTAEPPAFTRPRIVLSRCLEVEACRYNGRMIRSPIVRRLRPHVDFVPVCPEVEIGLGTPRDPIRMVRGEASLGGVTVSGGWSVRLLQPSTDRDLTEAMTSFRETWLAEVGDVDGFVLKSRSPSCGTAGVGVFEGPDAEDAVDRVPGMFAAAVLERFPDTPVEDEVGLADPDRLDAFLARAFALADLRRAAETGTMSALVDLQARHKLALMARSPSLQKELGRIVANAAGLPLAGVLDAYAKTFRRAMALAPERGGHQNALQHAQGYFRGRLTAAEKEAFGATLDAFRRGEGPREPLLDALRGWVERHGEPWLAGQTYLWPYPPAIMEPVDDDADPAAPPLPSAGDDQEAT